MDLHYRAFFGSQYDGYMENIRLKRNSSILTVDKIIKSKNFS